MAKFVEADLRRHLRHWQAVHANHHLGNQVTQNATLLELHEFSIMILLNHANASGVDFILKCDFPL